MIKILVTSDWHLTDHQPSYWERDYWEVQKEYLQQLREIANRHKVRAILVAGDMLEKPNISVQRINAIAEELVDFPCPIFTIAGNHDLPQNSMDGIKRSALWTLAMAGVVILSQSKEVRIGADVAATFLHYGQQLDGLPASEEKVRILVSHVPIYKNPPKWHDGASSPEQYLETLPVNFNVVVTGDVHQPLKAKVGGTLFLNPGGLIHESKKDKRVVYMLGISGDGEIKVKEEPIKLVEGLTSSLEELTQDIDDKLVAFVGTLQGSHQFIGFRELLEKTVNELPKDLKEIGKIIEEALENAGE